MDTENHIIIDYTVQSRTGKTYQPQNRRAVKFVPNQGAASEYREGVVNLHRTVQVEDATQDGGKIRSPVKGGLTGLLSAKAHSRKRMRNSKPIAQ